MRQSLGTYCQSTLSQIYGYLKKFNLTKTFVACFGHNIYLKALSVQKIFTAFD